MKTVLTLILTVILIWMVGCTVLFVGAGASILHQH